MLALRFATRRPTRLSPILARTYAQRFPDRSVGTARSRKPIAAARRPRLNTVVEHKSVPSVGESSMWDARAPASNPVESLSRLLLENNHLVVTREIEMLNIFLGFEQCNKYSIQNTEGQTLGFIVEEPGSFIAQITRQAFKTHRPFRALIMDIHGSPILWLRRPFSFINSKMFIQKATDTTTLEGEPVLETFAEVQQEWHFWRRRYNLFMRDDAPSPILSKITDAQPEPKLDTSFSQMARVDGRFWAWSFTLQNGRGDEIASVDRGFAGLAREAFTDTGVYTVGFVPRPLVEAPDAPPREAHVVQSLGLEERALVLALAVNIDFDYFSHHSGHGGGMGMFHLGGGGD